MEKEIKICLPFYKIAYSIFFIAVLILIRGLNFTFEIGVALEPQLALLAAVFCAETYVQEITSGRSEVERLYPMKNRMIAIFRRTGNLSADSFCCRLWDVLCCSETNFILQYAVFYRKRGRSVFDFYGGVYSHFGFLGDFFGSVVQSVSQYVGGDWWLPAFVDCHKFYDR